ncbi:MAG TPA: PIN domain-containing protein [Acidisarcina sp.]
MGKMRYIVDSDVLIHALNGTKPSTVAFLNRESDDTLAISLITWMEVMTGATDKNRARTRAFLSSFQEIHGITPAIAEKAVEMRQTMKLKLPDAIIYATTLLTGSVLASYNTKDYPRGTPSVHTPR